MSTPSRSRPLISLAAILLASLPALAASDMAAPKTSTQSIEQAVLEANDLMTKAANSLDADAFFEYIVNSDQTQIIQNGVIFKTRDDSLQAVRRGMMGMKKIDRHLDNPRVTVLGSDIAMLTSDGSVSAILNDGRIIDSRFAVSLVFVLREGKWKVLHGHYSVPVRQM